MNVSRLLPIYFLIILDALRYDKCGKFFSLLHFNYLRHQCDRCFCFVSAFILYFQQLKTALLSVNEANSTVNKAVRIASDYIRPAEVRKAQFFVRH